MTVKHLYTATCLCILVPASGSLDSFPIYIQSDCMNIGSGIFFKCPYVFFFFPCNFMLIYLFTSVDPSSCPLPSHPYHGLRSHSVKKLDEWKMSLQFAATEVGCNFCQWNRPWVSALTALRSFKKLQHWLYLNDRILILPATLMNE